MGNFLASRDNSCAPQATSSFRLEAESAMIKEDMPSHLAGHPDADGQKCSTDEGHGGSHAENLDDRTTLPSEEVSAAMQISNHGSLQLRQACDVHHPRRSSEQVPLELHHKLLEENKIIFQTFCYEKQRNCEIIRHMEAKEQNTLSLLHSVGVEDVETLVHYYQQCHGLTINLKKQAMEYHQKCMDLSSKIDKLEHLYSQKAMVESGSYQDSAATPSLLQTAVDGVNDAIAVCASEFFSRLKRNTNFNLALIDIPVEQRSPSNIKVALQALLCRIVFYGFGDPYFSLIDSGNSPFEIPSKRKSQLFHSFRRCRDREVAQLLDEDKDFEVLVHAKAYAVCEEIKLRLLSASGEDTNLDLLNRNDQGLHRNFLRFAKAVWVLHKLALAFEPSAEIFHVGSGSSFDDKFMEDIARDEYEEDDSTVRVKPQKE
ncbi:hypothetical protein GOP47_0019742, partial [Adiantum capillus-veneris]